MMDRSVDDMYLGCRQEMMDKVNSEYLKQEQDMTPLFKDVWNKAEQHAKTEDKALSKNHLQAIWVYTSDYKKFYKTFNDAVRTQGGKKYGTPSDPSSFKFHSLHFLLTSAIQILNGNYKCHTTYRRTDHKFTGKVNQFMRFGFFTSSSNKSDLISFGKKTCFKITTCSGASLKNYSAFPDEDEVLIPPYEIFKITEKIKGQDKVRSLLGVESCERMYILESAGGKTSLNCKAAAHSSSVMFSAI